MGSNGLKICAEMALLAEPFSDRIKLSKKPMNLHKPQSPFLRKFAVASSFIYH
jgi:hypothetical protein